MHSKQNKKPGLELSIETLRKHFINRIAPLTPLDYQDDSISFKALYEDSKREAAVLIPIIDDPSGPQLLLTRRADHLRQHPGQVSFPGGSLENESHVEAALREAEEEINLPPAKVDVIGQLSDYYTISGFRVTPIVGLVNPPLSLIADPNEVAEIIQVPFNHLMNPEIFTLKEHCHGDVIRRYFSTHYQGQHIWGITAGILMGFYEELLMGIN